MAGSYDHCVDKETGGYRGTALLENMRDMAEAVEEMFFMIRWMERTGNTARQASDAYFRCLRGEEQWPIFMAPAMESESYARGPKPDLGGPVPGFGETPGAKYRRMDPVEKYAGEARYTGVVLVAYRTTRGGLRYVVEVEPQGFQMIVTDGMIRKAEG